MLVSMLVYEFDLSNAQNALDTFPRSFPVDG